MQVEQRRHQGSVQHTTEINLTPITPSPTVAPVRSKQLISRSITVTEGKTQNAAQQAPLITPPPQLLPTRSDWFPMGPTTFQKTKFYENSDWGTIDFKKFNFVAAKFGGPVALIPLESSSPDDLKTIDIYSSSGKLLGKINITEFSHLIVGSGWNERERFVVVCADATVYIFTVKGELHRTWKMGGSCAADGVMSARIWGTGLVCLTKKINFLAVYDFDTPFEQALRKPAISQPPSSWTIIEPLLSPNGKLQVVLCTIKTQTVVFVTDAGTIDAGVSGGPFTNVAVSPSGKLIALFTKQKENLIWIVTSDFCNELVRFTVSERAPGPPSQFEWLANDAIACTWEGQLDHPILIVGTDGSFTTHHYDQAVHLVGEPDGLRVIGQGECGFLNRVSNAQKFIFMSGMSNEATKLYQASLYYHKDKNGPKYDAIMRNLSKQDLESAVNVLTVAAGFEFDPAKQKILLDGAALGRSHLDSSKGSRFDSMCRDLRILNAVRNEDIGILISFAQYQILTPQLLINRLLNRDMHHLAFKLCSYLNLPNDAVMVHWATRKVATNLPDDEILEQIVEKTRLHPGVSYAAVAYAAYQKNKPDLAASLLNFEAKAEEQVPLLIKMEKYDLSLEKACKSGDTDLIHMALLVLHQALLQTEFYTLLRANEEARGMWESYCRQTDRAGLLTMYRAGGGNAALAREEVVDAHNVKDLDERRDKLRTASRIFKQTDKFAWKQTEDEIALLQIQRELEETIPGAIFVGSSLQSTLHRSLMLGQEKRSRQIREQFHISNKRWWFIKIKAYTTAGKWDSLRRFSEQKSPIGYKPFFDSCFEAKNPEEAAFYVYKIADEYDRVKGLVALGKWMEACEAVKTMKTDPGDLIQWMKTKTTHNVWKLKVQELEEKWAAGELGSFFGDYDIDLPASLEDAELPFDVTALEETLDYWAESLEQIWNDTGKD